MPDEDPFLTTPIQPYDPRAVSRVEEALVALQKCSFQGRNLGVALEVLWKMVRDPDCLKVLTLAGAMIPAGMGEVVSVMIEEGIVDVIVATGANITHDLINGYLGEQGHYVGSATADDEELYDHRINRIYDVFLPDENYDVARELEEEILVKAYGTAPVTALPSEVFATMGRGAKRRCFVQVAAEHDVPVFCGATSDSDFGMLVGYLRKKGRLALQLDEVGDVIKFSRLIERRARGGTIIVGGGVPRNWAQQIYPFLEEPGEERPEEGKGYSYTVRLHTANENDGGLSGCTISESMSWGKYVKDATSVSVWVDATIALPLLVTGVLQRRARREGGS